MTQRRSGDLAPRSRVHIGLVVEESAPAWIAYIVETLEKDPRVILGRIVCEEGSPNCDPPSRSGRLLSLYERLDYRWFRGESDGLARVRLGPRLQRMPVWRVGSDAAQRQVDADLILDLTPGRNARDISDRVELGVWQYDHGDGWTAVCGSPYLLAPAAAHSPVVTTILRCYAGAWPRGGVLYRSHAARDPASVYRNRNAACWKSAQFVLRRIDDLCAGRPLEELVTTDEVDGPDPTDAASRSRPQGTTIVQLARCFLLPAIMAKAKRMVTRDQWFVTVNRRRCGLPTSDAFTRSRPSFPPRDRFYADPWLIDTGDRSFVFLEEYVYSEERGTIAAAELDAAGKLSAPRTVLRRPYHLSYPCVFEHDGHVYLVPESSANATVDLYRATDYPDVWEHAATLLSGCAAVDPTVAFHDGRFWLWTCIAPHGVQTWDELFVFFSASLTSGWAPHPSNPVVSDARRARPAGPVFSNGPRLMRPSQSAVPRYGAALVLNEIEILTPHEYREQPVESIRPSGGDSVLGVHTYSRAGDVEAFDAVRRISRLRH